MSFFELNGRAWPIEEGGLTEETDENQKGAFCRDGIFRRFRNGIGRRWKVQTALLSPDDASLLERILLGDGDAWSFDGTVFSAKGAIPDGTYRSYSQSYKWAADGLPVYYDAEPSLHARSVPSGGIGCALGSSDNDIWTANQRGVETNTAGFVALGGETITRDTTHKLFGSASLKVVTVAGNGGVRVQSAAAVSATAHAGSVYVMSTTNMNVKIRIKNWTTITDGTLITKSLTAYAWQRIGFSLLVAPTPGDAIAMDIQEASGASPKTFYVDGLQLEAGGFTSLFKDGARSANEGLSYALTATDAFTVSAWVKLDQNNAGRTLLYGHPFGWRLSASAINKVKFEWLDSAGATQSIESGAIPAGDGFHHVVAVIRSTGSPYGSLYVDGALVSSTGSAATAVENATRLDVCHENGTLQGCANIVDDVVFLPYPVDAAQVSGWYDYVYYTYFSSLADKFPALWLSGDCIPDAKVLVVARAPSSQYNPAQFGTEWCSAARSVSFELEEA